MKLYSNLNRLSLHDSYFTNLKRIGQNIELAFDWASLDNFAENNINEGIVLGATKLSIKGISNEEFTGYFSKEGITKSIEAPKDIVKLWQAIGESIIDETAKKIKFSGGFKEGDFWIEWTFNYNSCEVEWNNYVTFSEWKEGKLPNDC
ncbi:hypothetical protein V9L05_09555 [Bernardetia sp. Wsw4-3y2]|uniref:hypothetical protein n=1 Tax=Bernardetia sp. Wsw4-3y2 TaxID=3127471 RepID=UPI0030CC11DB